MSRRRQPANPPSDGNDRKNRRLTIIGIAISAVFGIGSIWYMQKTIDSSLDIAKRSGSFDKANNYLGIGTHDLPPSPNDTIKLIYGAVFDSNSIDISYLPLSIGNYGEKNAEDVQVVIDYPKMSGLAFTDTSLLKKSDLPISSSSRSVVEGKDMQSVVYSLHHLNPGVRVTIEDPFFLKKTSMSIDAKTADSVPVQFKVQYSVIFSVTLLGKDLRTQKRFFSLSCFEAVSMDELINSYVKNIKRGKTKNNYYYFVYPGKQQIHRQGKKSIHEYTPDDKKLYFATVKDLSPKTDIILALYNARQYLEGVKAYDWDNNWKADIPIK